jgi:hypothetical protein
MRESPVVVVVFRLCGLLGSVSVVVLVSGGWCVLVGASWVPGIGSVTVTGVRCERTGGMRFVGQTCYFEVRLSASFTNREMVSRAFLSNSSA